LNFRAGKAHKAKRKAEKEKEEKADDAKAGADVGKIVNLMAGDANKVWTFALKSWLFVDIDILLCADLADGFRSVLHLWWYVLAVVIDFQCLLSYRVRYAAPFEILIAGTFLFRCVHFLILQM
jgi:hypothetical protein